MTVPPEGKQDLNAWGEDPEGRKSLTTKQGEDIKGKRFPARYKKKRVKEINV